jgi:hypothetical protein
MFYQNLNNVFITSFTGSINSTMNVTIIVKQNLYNICSLPVVMVIQILLNCYLIITVMSLMIMGFHLHFILPVKEVL